MAYDAVPPSVQAVRDPLARIGPHVVRTPIHTWRGQELFSRVGEDTEVVLKLELFQHTGTFTARGALNSLSMLKPEDLAKGGTACSAGYHAIAVAYAAKAMGVTAKVVMMASANPARVARAKALGAEVLSAPAGAEAFALAGQIAAGEGRAVEPAGAATTAALFGPLREELKGKRVGLIVCGANIDIEGFAKMVTRGNE